MQGANIKVWCLIRWDTRSQEKDCSACWVEMEVRLKGGVPRSGRQHRHWGRAGSERWKNVGNDNVLKENLKQIAIRKKKYKTKNHQLQTLILSLGISVSLKDTSGCMEVASSIEGQRRISDTYCQRQGCTYGLKYMHLFLNRTLNKAIALPSSTFLSSVE